ncbi:hypothetical protein AB0D38_02430 [Streptomyces sp. NPDC048279]|uniref:hypothetical protein n=1 Tax=Streptomyces sp. NPDC048279 TaxID=3154714 RepID=UPI00344766A9
MSCVLTVTATDEEVREPAPVRRPALHGRRRRARFADPRRAQWTPTTSAAAGHQKVIKMMDGPPPVMVVPADSAAVTANTPTERAWPDWARDEERGPRGHVAEMGDGTAAVR